MGTESAGSWRRAFRARYGMVLAGAVALVVPLIGLAPTPVAAAAVIPTLTVSWPAPALVVGDPAQVTGAAVPAGQLVELQLLTDGAWGTATSTTSDAATGAFALAVPTDHAYTGTFRVYAHGGPDLSDVVSPTSTLTVSEPVAAPPAPQPTGRSVSASASSAQTVLGGRVTLRGRVTGGPAVQKVTLLQRLADGWHPVRSLSTRSWTYSFRVPTGWLNQHRLAVRADRYAGTAEARSRAVLVTVVPGYRPAGRPGSYRLPAFGRARWNPCQVIPYRVNRALMPRGGMRDVRGALARISQGSGLRFRYAGSSRHVPYARRTTARQGRGLYVAWSTPRQVPGLSGWTAGLGGWSGSSSKDAQGSAYRISYGGVVLDATQRLRPGFGTGQTLGELLMHEIGHTLGIEHVNDATQIMNPSTTDRPAVFGAGDLTALRRLGLAAGCF